MLKSFLLFYLLGVCFIGTSQVRYFDTPFAVRTTYNISFTEVPGKRGKQIPLLLDVYEPIGDTLTTRPVMVFAHGGGFIFGNKNNYSAETICTRFAQMGYVCVSINYRLGFNKKLTPELAAKETAEKAVNDLNASISFLVQTAREKNEYGIDTNMLIIGGSSAGGIMGFQAAYGQQAMHSEKIKGLFSLCGAINDTALIDYCLPIYLSHGTEDQMVPYGDSKIRFKVPFLFKAPAVKVQGSSIIAQHLENNDYPYYFHKYVNHGHSPYDKVLEPHRYATSMDITINTMRNFLFNTYWTSGPEVSDLLTPHATDIYLERNTENWRIYPVDKNVMKVKVIVETTDRKVVLKKTVKKKLKVFETGIRLKKGSYRATLVFNDYVKTFYFDQD